jgi:ribose transport system substrate-binding protein
VDVIVVKPLASLAPLFVAARKACIPVFTESRFLSDASQAVPGVDYVAHIGTDSVVQGQSIGEWLTKAKHGKANILEIEGATGSSPAIGRKKGFDERIADQPGMKILASESGDFDRKKGHDVTKALLARYSNADVVYTANDFMALGALDAIRESGKVPGKDVLLVSIDGFKEAVQHVIDGSIAAISFNSPKLGAITMEAIERYAAGEHVPTRVVVRGPIIDSTNAASMLSEAF